MTLCQTCCDAIAEPGSRRCLECTSGRSSDARTSHIAAPAVLPDVPSRIEACKRAILSVLAEFGCRTTGTRLSHALNPELRQHFAPAAAELVTAGLVVASNPSCRERAYELAREVSR